MKRETFIKTLMGTAAFMGLGSLNWFLKEEKESEKMPVLFIGHGSPMNAIELNTYTKNWRKLAEEIQKPTAILCISAHWLTKGSYITGVENPLTIHDFGGFPEELFQVQYPAKGSPELASYTQKLFTENLLHLDMEWGLDHGTWSILKHLYPLADVPTLQLSIDYGQPAAYHFELAKTLAKLRRKGVLIIGSGNMVHNLGMVAWDKLNQKNYAYDWATEMNTVFKEKIMNREFAALCDYEQLHKAAKLAIPTPDHYYPLMYSLGLVEKEDKIELFNDYALGGSLTMTSVKIA